MAPTPSLLVKYTVPDKGGLVKVTNRHHFSGGLPADSAHWTTLADAVVAKFKDCISTECEIVEVVGYDAVADVAVFDKAYTQAGAYVIISGESSLPGFCCGLLRWATAERTKKNHPIYLFSYVHGVSAANTAAPDSAHISTGQRTAMVAFAEQWWDAGFTDGVHVYRRAGPNGATAISSEVPIDITDHDLRPR